MKKLASSLVLAAALAAAAPAHAQGGYYGPPPPQQHHQPPSHQPQQPRMGHSTWYLGVGVVGTDIVGQSGGPEQLNPGGGLSAWLGMHVNNSLSLELGWLGSFHNPAPVGTWFEPGTDYLILEGVTADARIHLSGPGQFDPYLQAGVGLYFLGSEALGMDSIGTGFQVGGGFDVWVGPAVTLGVRARYHGISMGPPDSTERDTFLSAVTLEGSLGLHF
jgi:hypothetical protein